MRRRLSVVLGTLALMMVGLVPAASAHNLGPCNNGTSDVADVAAGATGANYAKHHIKALAQEGALGNGGHKPGVHHGFSACNPAGK